MSGQAWAGADKSSHQRVIDTPHLLYQSSVNIRVQRHLGFQYTDPGCNSCNGRGPLVWGELKNK